MKNLINLIKENFLVISVVVVAMLVILFLGLMILETIFKTNRDPRVITVEMEFNGQKYTTGVLTKNNKFDSLQSIYLYRITSADACCKDSSIVTPDLFISPSVSKGINDIEIRYCAPKQGYENRYHLYGVDSDNETIMYSVNKEVRVINDPLWEK